MFWNVKFQYSCRTINKTYIHENLNTCLNSEITSYMSIQNLPPCTYGIKYMEEYNLLCCFVCLVEVFHKRVKGIKSIPITSLDRPWGLQEFEAPRFQDNRHKKGGKVVSPTQRPPLLPRKYSCYLLLLEAESIPVRTGKITTPSGIEPANSRLVAQCRKPTEPPCTPHKRAFSRIFGARKEVTEGRRKFHYEKLYITFVQVLKSRRIIFALCLKEVRSARRVWSGWLKRRSIWKIQT
jgi:hypothetical protein